MAGASYDFLVGLNCSTVSLDGGEPQLNSGVILFSWVVVDAHCGQVVSDVEIRLVQPEDTSKLNVQALAEFDIGSITELENARKLPEVIAEFNCEVQSQCHGREFCFVCDGPNPIRQILHTDMLKNGNLDSEKADHFFRFFDLRKEYGKINNNNVEVTTSVDDILKLIGREPSTADKQQRRHLLDMATVTNYLLEERRKGSDILSEPESVMVGFEPGICDKDEMIDSQTVVRARGLPWQASDHDVAEFFYGLNIAPGGVALCLSSLGRRNGEALVRFETQEMRDLALLRHRQFMGNRYIEVYRATGEDFIGVAAGNSNEALEFLSRGGKMIVRMRGLPFTCTPKQIIEFFVRGVPTESAKVHCDEDGILFVNLSSGKASGDAFVLFESEEEGAKALAKHRQSIGQRYIELFRSTTAEVQQVVNQSLQPAKASQNDISNMQAAALAQAAGLAQAGLSALATPVSPLTSQQQMMISGNRKDFIRLRGLPYEAQVKHILEFLGHFSSHIVFQGVHMVYNAQGTPSGEAFIQMESEAAASATATDRHNKYMSMGRKERYIEVFQCSADDINLVLTTNAQMPQAPQIVPNGTSMMPNLAGLQQAALLNAQCFPGFQQLPQMNQLQFSPLQQHQLAGLTQIAPHLIPAVSMPPQGNQGIFWPYPSPPLSPSSFYPAAAAAQISASLGSPTLVLMRNLPVNITEYDIINYFRGITELSAECIQISRGMNGFSTGDAIISFPTRIEADRAVIEKNKQVVGHKIVELFLLTA